MNDVPIEVKTRTTNDWFGRFTASASGWLGSKWAFAGAGLVIIISALTESGLNLNPMDQPA